MGMMCEAPRNPLKFVTGFGPFRGRFDWASCVQKARLAAVSVADCRSFMALRYQGLIFRTLDDIPVTVRCSFSIGSPNHLVSGD
jgi:hypothetical protein